MCILHSLNKMIFQGKGKEFYILDESDCRIFIRLMKKSPEFLKLDIVDRNILVWLVNRFPGRLRAWIDYLKSDYEKRKSTLINSISLYREVKEFI